MGSFEKPLQTAYPTITRCLFLLEADDQTGKDFVKRTSFVKVKCFYTK